MTLNYQDIEDDIEEMQAPLPFKLKSSIHAFHNSGVNAKIQGRVLQMEHVDKGKENESPPVSR